MADHKREFIVGGKPISSLRVIDLKSELEKRGLPKSGSKKDLLERLKLHLQLEADRQAAVQDEEHVPNLSLCNETENDFVREYLAAQQARFQVQREAKKQFEEAKRESEAETTQDEEENSHYEEPVLVSPPNKKSPRRGSRRRTQDTSSTSVEFHTPSSEANDSAIAEDLSRAESTPIARKHRLLEYKPVRNEPVSQLSEDEGITPQESTESKDVHESKPPAPPVTTSEIPEPAPVEPEASAPIAAEQPEPNAVEPEAPAPIAAEPEPAAVEPEAPAPIAAEPEPAAVEPEAPAPIAAEPEPAAPAPVEPEASVPVAAESEVPAEEPEAAAPVAAEPETTALEPEAPAPATAEPEAAAPAETEPKAPTPSATELEPAAPLAVEPEAVAPAEMEPEAPTAAIVEPKVAAAPPAAETAEPEIESAPVAAPEVEEPSVELSDQTQQDMSKKTEFFEKEETQGTAEVATVTPESSLKADEKERVVEPTPEEQQMITREPVETESQEGQDSNKQVEVSSGKDEVRDEEKETGTVVEPGKAQLTDMKEDEPVSEGEPRETIDQVSAAAKESEGADRDEKPAAVSETPKERGDLSKGASEGEAKNAEDDRDDHEEEIEVYVNEDESPVKKSTLSPSQSRSRSRSSSSESNKSPRQQRAVEQETSSDRTDKTRIVQDQVEKVSPVKSTEQVSGKDANEEPDHQVEEPKLVELPKVSPLRKLNLRRTKSIPNDTDEQATKVTTENGVASTRKRKWGNSTVVPAKKPAFIISTDSLKALVPDAKLVPADQLRLSSPEPKLVAEAFKAIKQEAVERKKEAEPREDSVKTKPELAREVSVKDEVKPALPEMVRTVAEVPEEAASPARNPASSVLMITNLVRPFTILQLRELLQRTGELMVDKFWIDKIKSSCIAQYKTEAEAVETRDALHGIHWPPTNPKTLVVDFSTEAQLSQRLTSDSTKAKPVPATVDAKSERPQKVREWDKDKYDERENRGRGASRPDDKTSEAAARETSSAAAGAAPVESPAKLLDDLFRKTKTTPHIYWLPLTDQQIAEKEEMRRKRMAERQERLRQRDDQIRREQERNARPRDRKRSRSSSTSSSSSSSSSSSTSSSSSSSSGSSKSSSKKKSPPRKR